MDEDRIIKTGYWLRASQQQWLRQMAFERKVTASELLREILDKAIPGCPNGHTPATQEVPR